MEDGKDKEEEKGDDQVKYTNEQFEEINLQNVGANHRNCT